MSEVKKPTSKAVPAPEKQMPNNVVAIGSNKCNAESCSKKPSRAGFCEEHYEWFKEGLLTMEGYRAKDFDKKYHSWLRRKEKVA